MIEFTKIDDTRIVAENVTVHLRKADDGHVLGRVTTIGTGQGGDEAVSTADDDPPIEFALRIARELATAKGATHIDIVDLDGLWKTTWGNLKLCEDESLTGTLGGRR